MGINKKTAKGRLDKYYNLAKEQGFRARSAFKLIQLNKKFSFLEKSRVVIDLCAAPGGWLQVCEKNMPVSSIIIGVDRVKIKPIRNCILLEEDITTDHCRQSLKKSLHHWKADCILHDGSPNVGQTWLQDAYEQAELTLKALKLATEFLRPDGYFITKVFRSKDYFSLMWVLNKLFNKVHASKPAASRNVSAEIYIVCIGYKAPESIDPRMLDPRTIFEDVETPSKKKIFALGKKKTPALGYKEGNEICFTKFSVSEFLEAPNPISFLAESSEIAFVPGKDDIYENHPLTKIEIKECLKDIKVLSSRDLKKIISWRKKIILATQGEKKEEVIEEDLSVPMTTEEKENIEVMDQITELEEINKKKLKTAKKRERKIKLKNQKKLINKCKVLSSEIEDEVGLFSLKDLPNNIPLDESTYIGESSNTEDSGELKELDETDYSEDDYKYEKIKKLSEMFESNSNNEENKNKILKEDKKKLEEKKHKDTNEMSAFPLKSDLWFEQNEFKELLSDEESPQLVDSDMERLTDELYIKSIEKCRNSKIKKRNAKTNKLNNNNSEKKSEEVMVEDLSSDEDSSSSDSEREVKEKSVSLSAYGLALGTELQSKSKRRDLEDNSYNRYSFQDGNLPAWFVEDEKKHFKKPVPVPNDILQFYKERLKEFNDRPIKKVREAHARKKLMITRKYEKLKKKAESTINNPEMSSLEKRKAIENLSFSRLKKKIKPKQIQYVVAKKSGATRAPRRPKGVKGYYKMVDPRLKKDKVGEKRAKERLKNKKKSQKKK